MSTTLTIDGASTYLTDIVQGDLYLHNGDTTIGTPIDSLQLKAEKGQPDGYASLDSTGKVPVSQIPPLVIHDVFIVNNYVDLATLTTAQVGDVGIVTSDATPQLRGTYILTQEPSSLLANWYRVSSSTLVASVNGIPGPTVVLSASDITTGTLPVPQLPVLQATGDATGVSLAGTGSIPLTLTATGVTPGIYTRPLLNIDAKGRVLSALEAPNILYQQASTVDPSNNIIYRIGNADESSSLDMSGGCNIITPGNEMNVQCAQLNYDVVGSTARITTDDTLTLEGLNMVANIQNATTINTPNLNVNGISSATASDVLYYDSGTGNVTYGAPTGGGSSINYQAFYFNQTWTTPSNLATNTTLRFPIDGGVFPLISQGNLGAVFANSSTSFYDIRYTGATKTFKVTLKGYVRFFPTGVTNTTQITWTLFADRPLPLSSITVPGSRQLMAINDPAAGRNSYIINMQGIVQLNNTAVVSPTYFYAPSGAGTSTMIVDEMYILFEQLD